MEDKTTQMFRDYDSFGTVGDRVKAVVDEYHSKEWKPGMTIEDAERLKKSLEGFDRVVDLGTALTDSVNAMDPEETAKALLIGIVGQHRTLQAQTISALIKMLGMYRDAAYDGRNRAAVIAAERISQVVDEEHIYVPLI